MVSTNGPEYGRKPARFKYLVGLGSGFILQDLQGFRNLAGQDSSFREICRTLLAPACRPENNGVYSVHFSS